MILRLYCVDETDKARLYRRASGVEKWVPRSICKSVLKRPRDPAKRYPIHEVDIEDWWLEKNGWLD